MSASPELSSVRLGVIGAGQMSHCAAAAFAEHPAVRLAAVADPHPGRLSELADRFGFARRFADARQVLAEPSIDAVYIATPNAFHAPLACLALQQGKHVLLEKPFALDAVEAEGVVRVAREHGRVLSVSMNQRFRADSQRIRALVAQGDLGEVYHARAFWFRRTGIPKLGTWFGRKQLAGGGALLDIGVHLLDLALFVMGNFRPRSVSGAVHSTFGPQGLGEGGWGRSEVSDGAFDVDDFATALIRFENGATLSLDASWAMHQAQSENFNVLLHGSAAGAGCYPAELYRFGVHEGAPYQSQPLGVGMNLAIGGDRIPFPHESPYHNFVNHLLGSEELCVTLEQALVVQRVLDAIYASALVGREIQLELI